MERYKKIAVFILSLPLFFGACVSLKQPRNKIGFYTLEYDPPQIVGLMPLSHVIRMSRFGVAPIYNTNRIIYRDRSFKRDAYAYHKWQANPGDLVTYLLNRDMKASGLFKAVLPRGSRFSSPYILEGQVDEFFESDKDQFWEAVLSISIVFIVGNAPDMSKRVLFQKTYHAREPCKQKNPRALAEAMSRAMAEVSGKIIRDIHAHLKDRQ